MARKPASDDAVQASPVADFEASLDALEQLVEKMEHGELSLEESLAAYERGVGLYRRCQQALEQAARGSDRRRLGTIDGSAIILARARVSEIDRADCIVIRG